MRSWRRSAAYRIAFANFAAYAIGIAMLGAVVFGVIHVAFTRQLDAMVSDDAQTLADEFRSGGMAESTEAIVETRGGVQLGCFTRCSRRMAAGFYGSLRTASRPARACTMIQFQDPIEGPRCRARR